MKFSFEIGFFQWFFLVVAYKTCEIWSETWRNPPMNPRIKAWQKMNDVMEKNSTRGNWLGISASGQSQQLGVESRRK